MPDPAGKPQLHQSHIDMLYKCGVQYEFRYVRGIKSPPGVAALAGSGCHKGVEVNMLHKLHHDGELAALEDVQDASRDDVLARWDREGVHLAPEERERGENVLCGQTIDRAVAFATLHYNAFAPKIMPVGIEQPWVIELPELPMDLAGRFDLLEAGRLRDTKTSGKYLVQGDADNSLQLGVYSLAYSVLHGGQAPDISMDALMIVAGRARKDGTPGKATVKAESFPTRRTPEQLEAVQQRILNAIECIERGVFLPAAPDTWICSEKWCGYADRCRYYRGFVQI